MQDLLGFIERTQRCSSWSGRTGGLGFHPREGAGDRTSSANCFLGGAGEALASKNLGVEKAVEKSLHKR